MVRDHLGVERGCALASAQIGKSFHRRVMSILSCLIEDIWGAYGVWKGTST